MDVTVQRKLTEPVAPDEDVAVTATSYVPDAVNEIVPAISPLLLIDKPGGRPVAGESRRLPVRGVERCDLQLDRGPHRILLVARIEQAHCGLEEAVLSPVQVFHQSAVV